jgi:hypothetical protein
MTEVGECAFYGCTNLPALQFPEGLTKIGADAFSGFLAARKRIS